MIIYSDAQYSIMACRGWRKGKKCHRCSKRVRVACIDMKPAGIRGALPVPIRLWECGGCGAYFYEASADLEFIGLGCPIFMRWPPGEKGRRLVESVWGEYFRCLGESEGE
jgi:hypothetical protein